MIQPGRRAACQQIFLVAGVARDVPRSLTAGLGSRPAPQELNNIFQPVTGGGRAQFMVRLVDTRGTRSTWRRARSADAPGITGAARSAVRAGSTPSTRPSSPRPDPRASAASAGYGGRAWVNPVQIVRWEITLGRRARPSASRSSPRALGNIVHVAAGRPEQVRPDALVRRRDTARSSRRRARSWPSTRWTWTSPSRSTRARRADQPNIVSLRLRRRQQRQLGAGRVDRHVGASPPSTSARSASARCARAS